MEKVLILLVIHFGVFWWNHQGITYTKNVLYHHAMFPAQGGTFKDLENRN